MKRAYSTAALGLAILLSVLATACDNSNGVLSQIQKETVTNASDSKFYQAAVESFTKFDGYYYATMVATYRRPTSNTAGAGWATVSMGDLGTSYLCKGPVATSTRLYAAVKNIADTSTLDIYYIDTGDTVFAKKLSPTFDGTTAVTGVNVQALYSANDTLFAVVRDSSSNYVLYYLSGTNFAPTGISGSAWIPGVVYAGGYYWIAQGYNVYASSSVSSTMNTAYTAPTSSIVISAIAADTTNNRVFVGATTGYIYASLAGAAPSWTGIQAWNSDDSAVVTALVYLPNNNQLVAGRGMQGSYTSTYYGYYEINMNGTGASFSSSVYGASGLLQTNYDTTTKYLFVNGFYYDSDPAIKRLFILENASMRKLSGLWSIAENDGKTVQYPQAGWVTE
jgi:hypothetical protein